MKKSVRLLTALAAILMVLTLTLSGCASSGTPSSSSGSAAPDNSSTGTSSGSAATSGASTDSGDSDQYAQEVTIEILKRSDSPTEYVEHLRDDLIKEKFNMVWDESYVAASDYATKVSTLYAAGKEPDLFWAVRPSWGSDEWTEAGYFRGFTYDELISLIPAYETLWDIQNDTAWEDYIFPYLSYSDGKIYTLPTSRDTAGNMAYMYRQDVFDKCGIESFPTNPEEFLDVCRTIKSTLGITPLVDRNDNSQLFIISKWGLMWGLPDMLPDMPAFKNPLTGEMYYYVYASDTYREVVKFAYDVCTEGLMYSEFATASADQVKAYKAQGNLALMYDYPTKIAEHNALMVDAVPDVDWQWTDVVPSVVEGKFNIKKDNYHAADMRAFAASATDEQVQRMCDFWNWSLTEEGMTFCMYGVEGITYEVVDGKKLIKEEFATPLKPTGTDLKTYQINNEGLWKGMEYIETYQPVLSEWNEKILNKPGCVYVLPAVMKFTPEETAEFTETKTYLTDAVNKWLLQFMMGQKDPYNDADWNAYISELEQLGLHDVEALHKEVYERTESNP